VTPVSSVDAWSTTTARGAKGLFVPTVYGVRDSQWSWYYDQKQDGFDFDGLTIDPATGKSYYNGDLWSTAEPSGNTCLNWGKPSGQYSPEGWTIYNCQWPGPTNKLFPASLYHQCWIGSWEGEDSRSCWLADDMAVIDMRMHMNFGDAHNAFFNGKDSDDSTNDGTYNVVYVDSHDYGPNKSSVRYTGGQDAWAENMDLMWTFRGIPTLYYGSEIQFQAGKTIDCGPSCPLATTGRAYYGDHLEGTVTATDFSAVGHADGEVATTLAQPLVGHLQRLNMIRRAIPALQMGQYSTDGVAGGGISFKRRYTDAASGTDSFALVAVTDAATFTGIPNGTYVDAVTGDRRTVTGGTLSVAAPGKGDMRVYVLDLGDANAAPGKIGTDGPYLK
jgi:hypothetical protein